MAIVTMLKKASHIQARARSTDTVHVTIKQLLQTIDYAQQGRIPKHARHND